MFEPMAKIFSQTSNPMDGVSTSVVVASLVVVAVTFVPSMLVVILLSEEIPRGREAACPGLIERIIPRPTASLQ